MKCEYARLFLNEYVDNQLTAEQQQPIEIHLEHCTCCKARYQELIEIKQQLAGLHLHDPISDRFIEQAIANAAHIHAFSQRKTQSRWWKTGYLAIAASVILMVTASIFMLRPELQHEQALPVLSERQLNLLFEAPKELYDVTFTVTLPEAVEMPGFPGLKQVSWQGNIKKGKNLLTIPIITDSPQSGIITTELKHLNTKRVFKVDVRSDNSFKQMT